MTYINLEDSYDNKKGIYVLTLTGEKPYKIGMTNTNIYKRINSYVNCPSSHNGHWIHLLLTWDVNNDLSAKIVEEYIFRRLKSFRLNSTQRKLYKKTEHFNASLDKIKKVFEEAQQHYMEDRKVKIEVNTMDNITVKRVERKGNRNVLRQK